MRRPVLSARTDRATPRAIETGRSRDPSPRVRRCRPRSRPACRGGRPARECPDRRWARPARTGRRHRVRSRLPCAAARSRPADRRRRHIALRGDNARNRRRWRTSGTQPAGPVRDPPARPRPYPGPSASRPELSPSAASRPVRHTRSTTSGPVRRRGLDPAHRPTRRSRSSRGYHRGSTPGPLGPKTSWETFRDEPLDGRPSIQQPAATLRAPRDPRRTRYRRSISCPPARQTRTGYSRAGRCGARGHRHRRIRPSSRPSRRRPQYTAGCPGNT